MRNNRFSKRQTESTIIDNDPNLSFGFRAQVFVGTPPQAFNVLLDTGSNQFWVQSLNCANCVGNLFDETKSSTFIDHKTIAKPIRYVDGSIVNSRLISETVSLNDLSLNNYMMNLATNMSNQDSKLDGVMGFGLDNDNPTFVSNLFQKDPSLPQVFTYFIDSTDESGSLMIGGIDKSRFSGPIATETILPRESSSFWQLPINSLEIGGLKLSIPPSMTAIFDTGSSVAVFAMTLAQSINQQLGIPPLRSYPPGWYGIECRNGTLPAELPDLYFNLGGIRLKFTAKEYLYLQPIGNRILCISGIIGLQKLESDQSIIGNVLLRRYYTVFDVKNRKIGFATCNRQAKTQEIIVKSDLSSDIVGIADPRTHQDSLETQFVKHKNFPLCIRLSRKHVDHATFPLVKPNASQGKCYWRLFGIKFENPRLRKHLLKMERLTQIINKAQKSGFKSMISKFRSKKLLQRLPAMGNNAKKIMMHLNKRVMDNRIFGNDELNLFTYHGLIYLGSPPQQFKILFDTGSTRLWIRGPEQCPITQNCSTFNPSSSSTFSDHNIAAPKIQYGDGSFVEGNWVSDKVQVADTWINSFKFQLGSKVHDTSDEDGIMGLGFSQMRVEPTYWETLVNNKLVTSPVFSIFIDSTETSGAITFGGVDLARYSGPLTWITAVGSMRGSYYWGLELDSIIVGASSIPLQQSEKYPIVDTGTSLGLFPPELAKKINNQLGLQRLNIGGSADDYRGFPCPTGKVPTSTNLPNLVFTFGSATLTFTPQEYMFTLTDNDDKPVCISGIVPGNSNMFILGNVLIRRYYLVFDQNARQIGFALANRSPTVRSHFVGASATDSPLGKAATPDVNPAHPVPISNTFNTPLPIAIPV